MKLLNLLQTSQKFIAGSDILESETNYTRQKKCNGLSRVLSFTFGIDLMSVHVVIKLAHAHTHYDLT